MYFLMESKWENCCNTRQFKSVLIRKNLDIDLLVHITTVTEMLSFTFLLNILYFTFTFVVAYL